MSASFDTRPVPQSVSVWDLPLRDGETPRPATTRSNGHLRWLGASLLIGVTGGVLLGMSLYVAGEGDTVVEAPERAVSVVADGNGGQAAHKADKLTHSDTVVVAKTSFQAPQTERVGDHEVIKTHAYVEIATDLSTGDVGTVGAIPPFDAQKLINGGGSEPAEYDLAESSDPSDAAVTLVKHNLSYVSVPSDAPTLSDAAVLGQIKELRQLTPNLADLPVGITGQRILSRTLRLGAAQGGEDEPDDPKAAFRAIDVRVLPENLTTVAESRSYPAPPLFEERELVLGHGETLETVLRNNGADLDRVGAILHALSRHARGELTEGQHVRLLIAPEGEARSVQRVTLYGEAGIEEIVAANDRGLFISVAPPNAKTASASPSDNDDEDGAGISLYESLYGTALKNGVPRPIIEDLVRVFAYGVDLQHRTSSGDRLTLFFTNDEDGRPDLLYAALKFGDETRTVYRHRTAATGEVDYFDEEGRSLKKFLLRRPLTQARMSSPFGSRYHPILGYARMHNGVDWAAPRGTPIMAAGDGTVEAAGVHSGYGNRVEITHANGYATAYNHMARIAHGIEPGARVRLGQVIGFVGTTGLSTGPHVHYEVTINGRFVDPMKIRLPSGRELSGPALASFKQEEQQIDDLRRRGRNRALASHG